MKLTALPQHDLWWWKVEHSRGFLRLTVLLQTLQRMFRNFSGLWDFDAEVWSCPDNYLARRCSTSVQLFKFFFKFVFLWKRQKLIFSLCILVTLSECWMHWMHYYQDWGAKTKFIKTYNFCDISVPQWKSEFWTTPTPVRWVTPWSWSGAAWRITAPRSGGSIPGNL